MMNHNFVNIDISMSLVVFFCYVAKMYNNRKFGLLHILRSIVASAVNDTVKWSKLTSAVIYTSV